MKKIEVRWYKPCELKQDFGNPRKISEINKEKLKKKIEQFGDHDVIKINESMQVISGNQRVQAMLALNIETPILCKMLIGYTEKELKKINLDSNEHQGEWEIELYTEWQNETFELDNFNNVKEEEGIKEKEISELITDNTCPQCGYKW